MFIEVPNFIPVSVLLRKISQKYTVSRHLAKNQRRIVKLFQYKVSVSPLKKGRAERNNSFCFSLFSGRLSHISLFEQLANLQTFP
jgi:hypothetical protein